MRKYIPTIGKRVMLKEWESYSTRGIHMWAWLEVWDVKGDIVTVEVLNGSVKTGKTFVVGLSEIEPPIGWQPRYTIQVAPDKVDMVLSWFERGIVVRQSHDMSGSMPKAFQPMDNAEQPHWQFCEVTDAIPAEDCASVFRVVKVEREDVYDVYLVPDKNCVHCHGTGRDSLERVKAYRAERGMSPLDPDATSYFGTRTGWDAETETFECNCVRGGFKKLGRSKRAKLIKEWAANGWVTEYRNYGQHSFWERQRETVVKDWEEKGKE